MAAISPRAQRLFQQLRRTLTRYTEQGREQAEGSTVKAQRALGIRIGRLIQRLRIALHLTPTHFARRLHVTPQTVRRWETHQVIPRLSQLDRFETLLHGESPLTQEQVRDQTPNHSSFTGASDRPAQILAITRLGIGPVGIGRSNELSRVMSQAKAVWIFSSQRLGASQPGYAAEAVLKALQQGVHFHYVYPAGSKADHSFQRSLRPWLRRQSFTGGVTAYVLQEPRLAYQLGLADVPVTWMVMEFESTAARSGRSMTDPARRLAVLLQLRMREYVGSEHAPDKNGGGQDCWIELPVSQADEWLAKVRLLQQSKAGKRQPAPATKRIRTITI